MSADQSIEWTSSMTTPLFYPGANIKDPEQRVVETGLFLLKTWRRVPTQDEVTQALKLPDPSSDRGFRSTGKATVTKYWPSFQAALADGLESKKLLPDEIPDVVTEMLAKLVNWALTNANDKLADKQKMLEQRKAHMSVLKTQWEQERQSLNAHVHELTEHLAIAKDQLNRKETDLDELKQDLNNLKGTLTEVKTKLAVQQTEHTHLQHSYDQLTKYRDELLDAKQNHADKNIRLQAENDTLRLMIERLSGEFQSDKKKQEDN